MAGLAVNIAAVEKLPLVIAVANNQFAYSTPTDRQFACRDLADRAIGYGIEGHTVDGTDLAAWQAAVRPNTKVFFLESPANPTLEVIDRWSGPGNRDAVITPVPMQVHGAHPPHPSTDKGHFEHWYFDARLDDGHVIVGFLQTAELMTKKAGVELHVYEPDGTRHEVRKFYPHREASASSERRRARRRRRWTRPAPATRSPPAGSPRGCGDRSRPKPWPPRTLPRRRC